MLFPVDVTELLDIRGWHVILTKCDNSAMLRVNVHPLGLRVCTVHNACEANKSYKIVYKRALEH